MCSKIYKSRLLSLISLLIISFALNSPAWHALGDDKHDRDKDKSEKSDHSKQKGDEKSKKKDDDDKKSGHKHDHDQEKGKHGKGHKDGSHGREDGDRWGGFKKERKKTRPVQIFPLQPLNFGMVVAGFKQDVVVSATDANAAIFLINGAPLREITVSVVDHNVFLFSGRSQNKKIRVTDFQLGGAIRPGGRAVIGANGQLHNVRVGATAKVNPSHPPHAYRGTGRIRVVYL